VDPAARLSLRVIDVIALRQMAASGAGAGLGSGSLNATARGGASFSAPVSPGTMRGAGMEAFFEASALCEGGGGVTGLAAGTRDWMRRGKDKRQLRGRFRIGANEAVARGVRGG